MEADPAAPLVLGIDTGSAGDALALAQDGLVIAARQGRRPRRQGAALTVAIEQLTRSVGRQMQDIAAISLGLGPGAFTGLRVGIATAQGIASGLDIPTYGVCSLKAWAATVVGAAAPVAVTLDARRAEVYSGLFMVTADGIEVLEGTVAQSPEAWFEGLAARSEERFLLVGDGARLYAATARRLLGSRASLSPWGSMAPDAGWVALEGARRLASGEEGAPLRPVYLRDHDAAKRPA